MAVCFQEQFPDHDEGISMKCTQAHARQSFKQYCFLDPTIDTVPCNQRKIQKIENFSANHATKENNGKGKKKLR